MTCCSTITHNVAFELYILYISACCWVANITYCISTLGFAVIENYKEKYKRITKFCDENNYALGQTREYIDLVFMLYRVRKTKDHLHRMTILQHGGNIDKEAVCETYFSNASMEKKLSGIFNIHSPFTFIFEGTPGIGKTMVAKQIASEWANGEILGHITLLLLLYFRDPGLQKVQNFEELMQHLNASSWEKHFSERQGRNLLLVFDGYDELPPDTNMYSFFAELLSGKILSCCSIVFTSRSYSTVQLHHFCKCRIEILGFSENDRFDFLTKNKVSDKETDRVRTFFEENLIINSLCYIPFNMESLLLLLLEKDLPKTQTQLTERSVSATISHYIKKSCKCENIEKQDLEIQVKKIMDSLAPLAFEMIKNKKIVFTKTEIKNSDFKVIRDNKKTFGLIQTAQFTDVATSADTLLYSFVHFSVQEYLAAYYLSQRFSIAQLFQIHHNFWDERYFAIWKMYTGITQGKKFPLQHFLSGENFIIGGIRYLTNKEFPGVSDRIMANKVKVLLLYQMFLEAPDSKINKSVTNIIKNNTIDLSNDKLHLQDVSILTYCIARSYITMNWKLINLSNCQIGDEECSKIFQGLSLDDGRQKPAIQYLDLSYNEITFEGCFDQNSSHVCSTVIHCLNISDNSITNFKALDSLLEGSKVTDLIICHNKQQIRDLEMLKHTDTIKDLNLSYNKWPTVQWNLPSLPSLLKLDMSHSTFNEDDLTFDMINTIPFPCLQELILSHCGLSDDACAILFNAIPKTVRLLKLSHNQINDQALVSLQELFKDNKQLQELYLVSTELNGTSASSCAQALTGCKQLQILDISENDMSDDEAELVMIECCKISSLKELKLKDILITEKILSNVVKNNTFDWSNDKLYLQNVSILTYCIARSYITMNWELINLSNCQIGDKECSKIFHGFSLDNGLQKPTIQHLDLSNNEITFERCFDENSSNVCLTVIHCLNISDNSITNFKALDNLLKGSNVIKLIICRNKQQITDLKMLKHTHTIKDLNLSYNRWPTVQWSLPSLPSLHKLDMSHSTFNEDDLTLNVINTIPFPHLQELILSHCGLSDDACAILFNAIPKTVRLLNLSHNQIDDQALASLQNLFNDNNQLQELYLISTELNGVSASSCAKALIGCKKLRVLDISENNMTYDEADLVISICHNIFSLKDLKLMDIPLTEDLIR